MTVQATVRILLHDRLQGADPDRPVLYRQPAAPVKPTASGGLHPGHPRAWRSRGRYRGHRQADRRHGRRQLRDPQLACGKGVKNTHAQHIGGGFDYPWGRVKLTMALHGSGLPDGSYGGNPCGLLLTVDGKKIYHAGDTGLFGDMRLIGEEGLDLAILPIGDNFTMGPDDALRAVKLLRPKR